MSVLKCKIKKNESEPGLGTASKVADNLLDSYRRFKSVVSAWLSKGFNQLSRRTQLVLLVFFCVACSLIEFRQVYLMLVSHTKNEIRITLPHKIPMPNDHKDSLVIFEHIYKTYQKIKDYDTTLDNR